MAKKEKTGDINKINPEEYNPRQMMNTANTFLSAAKKCNNDPSVELIGWSHPLLVPIVTNTAFACELFLKALLQKSKMLKGGHNLLDLFQDLPDELKSNIIGPQDSNLFIEELTRVSCLFEEWRYIYERQLTSLNFRFLLDFAEGLSTITNKIV